jgi:hypothetical protein
MGKDTKAPENIFSIRDRFACAALQGMLASGDVDPIVLSVVGKSNMPIAKIAYGLADAMLEARDANTD